MNPPLQNKVTWPDSFLRREWPFVDGLEAWLDKATGGLCADAVERVCREVVEHCKGSVEAKLAAGMPLEEVDRAVMGELGSWRAARRAFRKTNLTHYEELGLQHITTEQSQLWVMAVLALLLAVKFAVISFILDLGLMPFLSSVPILLFATTPQWAMPILKRLLGLDKPRRLIRGLAAVQWAMAAVAVPWLIFPIQTLAEHLPELPWFFVLVAAIPVCMVCYLPYLIWNLQYKLPPEEGATKA